MHDALYQQLAEVEDRLWWHAARRELIRTALRRFDFVARASALDIGCGTGGTLSTIREFAPRVIGLDRSPLAVEWARKKNPELKIIEGDATTVATQFPRSSFELVTLLNVLEHTWVRNEQDILRQVFEVLKPGGVVLVTSAAFPGLARRHDRMAMSRRRHRLPQMRGFLKGTGFEDIWGTYFNLSSFPIAWISACLDRLRRHGIESEPLRELSLPPEWLNTLMKGIMTVERTATRMLGRLPIGVSLLCVGRKPSTVSCAATSLYLPALTNRSVTKECDVVGVGVGT